MKSTRDNLDNWKSYVRSNQNITAAIIAIFALIILYFVLFQNTDPGVMDFGEYTQTLYKVGLNWRAEDMANASELQFTKVIEKYSIENISVLKLLQIKPAQTLIYPVSFISLICKVLQIDFSTKYLAILLATITVICLFMITKVLYCNFRQFSAVIGMICCFILLCGNHIIYFNSLYNDGIYLVSMLIFLTVLLRILIIDGKRNIKSMMYLMAASLFVLNANEQGIFMLPVMSMIILRMFFYCKPEIKKIVWYSVVCILAFCFVVSANIRYTAEDDSFFSSTRVYHAFFTGILPNAENPEEILKENNLPVELVADMGKSCYLSEDQYVIAPYSKKADQVIFKKLNIQTLLKIYIKHPEIYLGVLDKTAQNADVIGTSKFLFENRKANQGTEWVERFVWWQWVRNILVPETWKGYLIFFGINGIMAGVFFGFGYASKRTRAMVACYLILISTAVIQFMTACAFNGFAEVERQIHPVIISCDFCYVVLISCVLLAFWKAGSLLQPEKITQSLDGQEEEKEILNLPNPLADEAKNLGSKAKIFFGKEIINRPGRAALFVTAIAFVIMVNVLFFPRIGAYNNGDFGRMMSAMNIEYTQEDWKNADELSLTKVIENYDWVDDYDYSKIMFYNADLTQAFMSLAEKLVDNWIGLDFSTVYITILYVIILSISFFTIMKVMFHRFGKKWLWMGIVLIFIFFDRDNLGWLNSLFGEGPAFVGLIMVIASSLYIVDQEPGTCFWSFFTLLFSINFFAGSKAQFTVTAPLLLGWAFILLIYHTPKRIWKAVLYYPVLISFFAMIAMSAVSVYKNNDDISSPDTVFQSVFYGALMISEDPAADLRELGLDPKMIADIGKHAYLDKSEYYCAPRTEMAERLLYSKVNTFTMLRFYLRHPKKFVFILNETAKAAARPMPDFVLYVGQKTTEKHDVVDKFGLWQDIRLYIAGDRLWQLAITYILVILFSFRILFKKKYQGKDKLLIGMYLVIVFIGLIQFPLTFIGNGYADNTKQLYIFRLTYDIVISVGVYLILPWFISLGSRVTEQLINRKTKEPLKKEMQLITEGNGQK